MPRVLYVASDLGSSGPAKLISLLAPALPRPQFEAAVVDLSGGASATMVHTLREAGVPCYDAALRGVTDLRGLRNLRRVVKAFAPDVIHVGGPKAAYAMGLLWTASLWSRFPPIVASGLDAPTQRLHDIVARLVAPVAAEAMRCLNNGVPVELLKIIDPAVAAGGPTPDGAAFRASLGILPSARLVIAAGRFDTVAGLKSAVWAFDVVKYVAPDLHLVLVGDGPERDRLERFAKALGFDDYRVHFVGVRDDVPALLSLAELVWVTHDRGGVNVALEAMAAGKLVVAFGNADPAVSDLAEILVEGVTGRFVPYGDRVRLAAISNELLEAPEVARALGEAGRRRAVEHFGVPAMAARYAALYNGLVRTPSLPAG